MAERVADLTPGDEVRNPVGSAVFVVQTPHPLWPHLQMVVWRLDDGSWSHDALDARQVIGDITPSTPEQREERLRHALLGRR